MTYVAAVPTDLLAELRNLHQSNSEVLENELPDFGLHPLSGGRNNHVYAWTALTARYV